MRIETRTKMMTLRLYNNYSTVIMANTSSVKEFCDKHKLTMHYDQDKKTLNISNNSRVILSQMGIGSNKKIACNDAANKCFDTLRALVNRNEKIHIHKFIGRLPHPNNNNINLRNEDDLQIILSTL